MPFVSKLLVGVALLNVATAVCAQESKPNILLIMADDMGYTDIGSFGAEFDTRNLDELAREGIRFSIVGP